MPKRRLTRRERRQASREQAKVQQAVVSASSLTAATSYTPQDALAFLALGLLAVVPYLPSVLWGGFVWDDRTHILEAELVREVSGLWQLWFSPSEHVELHYWPLVYTTFWLEHKLWGFDPLGYHIVNVLMHLGNTLLVWHLLRRWAVSGAWVVAAVFAVHPLHVDSVAWIIERKDLLSGLFYLVAVLVWMRFVEQPSRGRYLGSLALYVAALLSKSMAVTLPAALLIWHWWQQGRVTATDLKRIAPFFVVGAAIVLGDLSFYRSNDDASFGYSLAERTLIAAHALWFYVSKLLWPTGLAIIYPHWEVGDGVSWACLVAAAVLVAALWHFRSRIGRGPLAGMLFFAVTLSPTLGFVDFSFMRLSFVADRFQYLAGMGVMAVVIGGAAGSVGRLSGLWRKGALAGVGVVLVMLGMLTWRQAGIYQDNVTFYRHIIALNPQASVHRNLALALYEQGRYKEALEEARVEEERYPNLSESHTLLGQVFEKLGLYEEFEHHLRQAIALNPHTPNAYHHLGKFLYEQDRYEEALDAARVAVEQRPEHFKAHITLGMVLTALGQHEEAEHHLRQAIALNPHTPNAYHHLGKLLYEQGRHEEAVAAIAGLSHKTRRRWLVFKSRHSAQ